MSGTEMRISAYACYKNAADAIVFYTKAFGAVEQFRLAEPSGRIGHAEIKIGGSVLMMSDEYPDFGAVSASTIGGCPITLHLYVADVDSFVDRAVKAGATLLRLVKDEFYGDRTGQIADPFGYKWMIATQREAVTPQDMQKRWSKMLAG
ncbi:MAG: VOC family protein [Alphaproteobacteria bacterium]|nr:VOC family protein [Alphaproteobacteria bacterium]